MVPKSPQSPLRKEDIIFKIGTVCVFYVLRRSKHFVKMYKAEILSPKLTSVTQRTTTKGIT